MNVLFVCLGNICRSPLAEGILKDLYQRRSIKGTVESVGLMDWNADKSADARAIAVAHENGLDLPRIEPAKLNAKISRSSTSYSPWMGTIFGCSSA